MNLFSKEAITESNPKYTQSVARLNPLYERDNPLRSEFYRDYTRILHSTAYRRLKNKTQVFYAPKNDHICTRIEHVNHVASVSYTIGKYFGLNLELISAIANGHDLGHSPFGHQGEMALQDIISQEQLNEAFWHEKNSLWLVDNIETLADPEGFQRNLSLTYAVRDGIILHCGEVDENGIKPRSEYIKLEEIKRPNEFQPFTWEGCVVKIADKISYLGRDIEDAITLEILAPAQINEFLGILKAGKIDLSLNELNNTSMINLFIENIVQNSSPQSGITLSESCFQLMNEIKKFNYRLIINNPKLARAKEYISLMMKTIFGQLKEYSVSKNIARDLKKDRKHYPRLIRYFENWMLLYSSQNLAARERNKYRNKILYDISDEKEFLKMAVDFMSAMTDSFAIEVFQELITFR